MRLSIRIKIFLALLVIIIVGLGITGLVLSLYLKENMVYRIEKELARHAMLARALIYKTDEPLNIYSADALADLMGQACSARVTIILNDGRIVGDSELSADDVRLAASHSNREEFIEAMNRGFGKAIRYSTIFEHEMLYVAVRFEKRYYKGVLRVSKPLSDVSAAIDDLRRVLIGACFVGVLIAGLISMLSSMLFSRRLSQLVKFAEQLVVGERKERIDTLYQDELGGLAGSLNELSSRLEEHVTTLAEERDQFEAVLDAMSESVMALDQDGQVTLLNRAGTILLGMTKAPLGKMLLEAARVPVLYEIFKSAKEKGESTKEFDLPGDTTRRILARASRLSTGGVLIVLQDFTELRRLEGVRRDFVSNVSHELRTPVSIIQANAETLLDGAMDEPEMAKRFLDAMISSTSRLTNIIADLLDLSRIEEGQYTLKLNDVQLNTSLRRAAAALETKAMERDFTIRVEPTGALKVKADVRALDQVLFNLVDNAVKYAGKGGKVVLRAKEEGENNRIEVVDNGPGIEARYRDRLFERFFRVDKGRSREMGGTGLGLAIVKHLVSAMGGQVGMTPGKDGGSIFWVVLSAVK